MAKTSKERTALRNTPARQKNDFETAYARWQRMMQNGQFLSAKEFAAQARIKNDVLKQNSDMTRGMIQVRKWDAASFSNAPAASDITIKNVDALLAKGVDVLDIARTLTNRSDIGGIGYLMQRLWGLGLSDQKQEELRATIGQSAKSLMSPEQQDALDEDSEAQSNYGASVEANHKAIDEFWSVAADGRTPKAPEHIIDWAQLVAPAPNPDAMATWAYPTGSSHLPLNLAVEAGV